jgi:hypothetical protein
MSFIINQIKKAKMSRKLVCICINTINWNNRVIGYVKQIYPPHKFELEVIDEFGQQKNKRIVSFTSVKSLEIGGTYNDNLEKLNKNGFVRKQMHSKYFSVQNQDLYEKLCVLKNSKTLCTFFFKTEYSIGIVKRITKHEMSIKNITYEGRNDGISIFDIALLTKIRIGSAFENRITFLSNKKFK